MITNSAGADMNITLGVLNDSEFIVDTSHGSIAEISQDKRTVTIHRVGSNHIAVVIKPKIRTID